MAQMEASDWFSLLLTGKATADDGVAKGHAGSTGNDRKFGGHVIWSGKPLSSGKIDRGLRLRKERTCRDADMTCPLARVENR